MGRAPSKTNTTKKKTPSKATAKNRSKTSSKSEKPMIQRELERLFWIALTLIVVMSLHTDRIGVFGDLVKGLLLGLFGYAGYVVPYVILAAVLITTSKRLEGQRLRWYLMLVSIYMAILIFTSASTHDLLHLFAEEEGVQLLSVKGLGMAYGAALTGTGGGSVGMLLAELFILMIGKFGYYVLGVLFSIMAAVLAFNVSITTSVADQTVQAAKAVRPMAEKLNTALDLSLESELKTAKTPFRKFDSDLYFEMDAPAKALDEVEQIKFNDGQPESVQEPQTQKKELTPELKAALSEVAAGSKQNIMEAFNEGLHGREITIHSELPEASGQNDAGKSVAVGQQQSSQAEKTSQKAADTLKSGENETLTPLEAAAMTSAAEAEVKKVKPPKPYRMPPLSLLSPAQAKVAGNRSEIIENAKRLESTLMNFGVEAKVIEVSKGPAITMYEMSLSPGVKVSKVNALSDDIALALAASQVRIIAPIPGKSAIGIEIPNKDTTMVSFREILESQEYKKAESKLSIGLGKDITGRVVIGDLAKMPHLLVAGATGSGKSVCINTMIQSILYHATPEDVKLLMIDPKVVELSHYNGIPHLILPVVTDPKKASIALNWAVQEMTNRYKLFADTGVKEIKSYQKKAKENPDMAPMPYIVVIIDELADLMMVAPNQVEDAICRLAQMARAAGIHLIVATQRPSVDVITGLIKANIPSRIAFAVSSQVDSRTILDGSGAEKLLGRGDMLFHPVGANKAIRIQGAFVSDEEVEKIVDFIKNQVEDVEYKTEILDQDTSEDGYGEADEHLMDAIELVVDTQQASISMLQRKFRLGYNRAARLVDQMEERGIVGQSMGSKPREVLIDRAQFEEWRNKS
ncbi:FtsK/SpoIIIE family DNA translocase [Acidaminobacter hydrogenoformans]|uniref:DNA segregation ATPase FtsK/SpoIIIE, S-DNA-T family n=1 Tax=Acidaminobacter hydrogenoformans DSM 2784 TaxID=1120920 RepID=A0A1G5RS39_9FIRM|nr:DNA translocase FtsK [Acidaminobacter hydrogenoformans]SCZ76827.1 DNA segregation ATPase FtsK/SpoIIIE, S-DNA-T family [Acidaminobacter hydrogenoformans DSM 2784]